MPTPPSMPLLAPTVVDGIEQTRESAITGAPLDQVPAYTRVAYSSLVNCDFFYRTTAQITDYRCLPAVEAGVLWHPGAGGAKQSRCSPASAGMREGRSRTRVWPISMGIEKSPWVAWFGSHGRHSNSRATGHVKVAADAVPIHAPCRITQVRSPGIVNGGHIE